MGSTRGRLNDMSRVVPGVEERMDYFTRRQQAKTTPLDSVPRRFSQCRWPGFLESRFIESLRGATTNPRFLRSYGGLVSLSLFWLRQHNVITFDKRICSTQVVRV